MKINPSHQHNELSKTSQSRNYHLSQGLKRPLNQGESTTGQRHPQCITSS